MILLSLLLFVVLVNAAHIERDIYSDFGSREMVDIDGKQYFLGNVNVDWYQAEIDCNNLGMQLLTLDTQEKFDFWSIWMEDNPSHNYWTWTSGRREAGSDEFIWTTTGQPFNATTWGPAEPNVFKNYTSCVDFDARYWEDDYCQTFKFLYICEELPIL